VVKALEVTDGTALPHLPGKTPDVVSGVFPLSDRDFIFGRAGWHLIAGTPPGDYIVIRQ
jgi:hypothetical protein